MGFLDKFLGKKKVETLPAVQSSNLPSKEEPASIAVVMKGKKYFDIFKDGNGYYRAQHRNGDWLFTGEQLIGTYEYAKKQRSLEDIEESCCHYIKSQQLTQVGTIEFIPSK
jgi:hypothetical protein